MKKANSDDLRPAYRREDLGPGVRGKYIEAYRKGWTMQNIRFIGVISNSLLFLSSFLLLINFAPHDLFPHIQRKLRQSKH